MSASFALAAAAGIAAIVIIIVKSESLPRGPVEPVWDKTACAQCRMHLSEPGFAAQIQTSDGEVLFFDDPGELLAWRETNRPDEHAVYFHHRAADVWLSADEVAFVRVSRSPMGYGLAAVDRDTPGAIGIGEATRLA
ncbi:hypothetical protein K8I61_12515, partial [bacterium]|nr:hypothetical protein [bacterium]